MFAYNLGQSMHIFAIDGHSQDNNRWLRVCALLRHLISVYIVFQRPAYAFSVSKYIHVDLVCVYANHLLHLILNNYSIVFSLSQSMNNLFPFSAQIQNKAVLSSINMIHLRLDNARTFFQLLFINERNAGVDLI